jgi:ATP-dependent Clp protease ATP-binding subunit ClpC
VLSAEDVAVVLSKMTGIPLFRMEENESRRLLRMEEELTKAIVGQTEAIRTLAQCIRRARAGLGDPRRPIGTFVFLGPTGVGKTELARQLAEFLFEDVESLIRIDMSEYMEKFAVSRLIGAPPGYVGYEEGGQLTEKVRRKPYSVVLFDEIEKAHPEVINILLQILEEGMLTDSLGRKVNFRNTILIITSNLGTSFAKDMGGLGFAQGGHKADFERMKTRILDEAKRAFRPELFNRVDDVMVFRQLTREDVARILELELAKVCERIAAQKVVLRLGTEVKTFLIEKGFSETYGARPLRRAVEKYLQDPIAEEILAGRISASATVNVQVEGDKLKFEQVLVAEIIEPQGVKRGS